MPINYSSVDRKTSFTAFRYVLSISSSRSGHNRRKLLKTSGIAYEKLVPIINKLTKYFAYVDMMLK